MARRKTKKAIVLRESDGLLQFAVEEIKTKNYFRVAGIIDGLPLYADKPWTDDETSPCNFDAELTQRRRCLAFNYCKNCGTACAQFSQWVEYSGFWWNGHARIPTRLWMQYVNES